MPRVLILTDGKAGHENQSRAFAMSIGCEAEVLPVRFRFKGAKALSYLLDRLGAASTALLSPPPGGLPARGRFDAVIGTGSGVFYAAKAIARRLGVPCGVVLYPRGYSLRGFGCILAPSFDRPAARANVVPVPVNLTSADAAFYASATKEFLKRHPAPRKPAAAVILGGPNKIAGMDAAWARAQLERVFAETEGCERWITTSRRTPPEVEAVVDSFPFDWKLVYSRDRFNPIPASAVDYAEQKSGRRIIRVDTPALNVSDSAEARREAEAAVRHSREIGADFCLIHHTSVEQLVNKNLRAIPRLPDYLSMIRAAGLLRLRQPAGEA